VTSNSRPRTEEVRHIGFDTVAAGFAASQLRGLARRSKDGLTGARKVGRPICTMS
jgi:hypothetical protein